MLGEQLTKLREKYKVTINDLSVHTKIQEKYLKALESDFYDKLPSPVYIRGYLREYENFFNLREEVLVKVFEKEYRIYININEKDEQDVEELSKIKTKSKIVVTLKFFIITFVSLIFLCIVGYLYYGVNKFVSAPWITIESPKNGLETDKKSIIITGFTHPDAILEIGGRKVFVDTDGSFSERVSLMFGENLINIKSKSSTNKISERVLRIFSTKKLSKNIKEITEKELQNNIIIKSGGKNFPIFVKIDNFEKKELTLKDLEEYQFNFKDKILISTKNGSDIKIVLNGKDVGILSDYKDKTEGIIFEKK